MPAISTLTALSAALAVGFAAYAQSAAAQDVEGVSVYGQSSIAPNAEWVSVKVSYGDLNLSTETGARVMLQRIHNAAATICGTESGYILDRVMIWLLLSLFLLNGNNHPRPVRRASNVGGRGRHTTSFRQA
jgi:UrcA family protein